MLRKLISAVMVIACLFMLVAGAFGIRDIMQEKSDGEKEKAATLEKLDTLKAGKEKLESNRADYEEGKTAYADGTAAYEKGKADYAKGQQDLKDGLITTARQRSLRVRPTMPPVKSSLPMGRSSMMRA